MKEKYVEAVASLVTKEAANRGVLIEAGWTGYALALPKDLTKEQFEELKFAFFSGADHLFCSIMNMMDPGHEETEADLHKMSQIHEELERFRKKLKLRLMESKGRG